ncbi:hypothetical protein B0I31_108151 [Saccharothrix carnea]|uniref:4-amino-4-deoxy-L-arabinose transferase-like glycosyltransferase n=1 Tax=Saccharothrix carnea TaxID=1280637 RepID=A0A2P8I5G3_SACCR|nr:hypothetical protein [Saccharothrix carnea]PSL53704.1 hypothetical protein B0I31_108151 [Saccharothrix carnea]
MTATAAPERVTDPASPSRPARRSWPAAVTAVAGGTALIAAHGALYGNWVVDDAAITFAYARNVADGEGSVLQPGLTPTEGYSNPAWLALLALGKLVGLFDRGTLFGVPDYVLFPKALAVLCCAGVLLACHTAARRVFRRPGLVTVAFGAVLAAIPSFVVWVFSGLENPLYALVICWLAVVLFGAVLDDRLLSGRVAVTAGLLVALAALTRPDGLVYAGAYPLLVLLTSRRAGLAAAVRSAALSTAVFLVPFGAYVAWRRVEFGRWLALPAVAKSQGPPEPAQFTRVGEVVHYTGALAVLVVAVCVGLVLARGSRLASGLVALLVPLGLALLGFAVLAPDWMEQLRFATPVWVLGALTAVFAVARALGRGGARRRAVLSVALVVAIVPSAAQFATAARQFRAQPTVPMCLIAETFGRGFNGPADILGVERATLLLPDVGGTALTSRLAVVDLVGLAEPRLADLWGARDMPGVRDYVFERVKPTFIHSHGSWSQATGIAEDPRMAADYHVISAGPVAEDWVRRDAVPDEARLTAMRDYLRERVTRAHGEQAKSPRGRCGPALRPGQQP